MPRKSRIIRLVILCTILCTTVLAVLLAVRRPVPTNEIALTPEMFRNEGKLLSIEDGELRGFKEILFSEIPSVGLLAIHRQRNLGGLWTAVTESEYTYLVNLRVTNMDVEYAPQKASGKPDRDYWADKTCEAWPDIKQQKTSSYVWSLDPDKLGYPILFKTFDGTTGVLKVTTINEDEIHLRYRIIKPAAQVTAPKTANINDRYIEKLPNGTGVELIGINSHPSGNNPWWKPDGREVKRGPYFNTRSELFVESDEAAYEIAWRIIHSRGSDFVVRPTIRVSTSLRRVEVRPCDEFNNPAFDVGAAVFAFKGDAASTTIEFGILTGARVHSIVVPSKGPRKAQFDTFTFEVSLPAQENDRITVDTTVPQALIDEYWLRPMLFDHDEKPYTLHKDGLAVADPEATLVKQKWLSYPLDSLRPSDIKECRIDFCRYQWIKFKNVSLRPGEDPGFETEAQSL